MNIQPIFPNFKQISLDNRELLQNFLKNYEPYSDFNFVSLYVWNGDNAEYCFLNGNLVIRMNNYDYGDDKLNYSILGTTDILTSIEKLKSLTKEIKLVPNVTIASEEKLKIKYKIIEDRDNFDYLYTVENIKNLDDPIFKKKRYSIKKFQSTFPKFKVSPLGTQTKEERSKILKLLDTWHISKSFDPQTILNSKQRFSRFFEVINTSEFIILGIFIENKLKAFTTNEIINNDFAIQHFSISDWNYEGLSDFLFNETIKLIPTKFINTEQDGGLEGLRQFKESWRPSKSLKKYSIQIE